MTGPLSEQLAELGQLLDRLGRSLDQLSSEQRTFGGELSRLRQACVGTLDAPRGLAIHDVTGIASSQNDGTGKPR